MISILESAVLLLKIALFRIEAVRSDPNGVVHVFRSRYLKTDVAKLLKSDTIPVYIDRYNESIGFVDIDAVLPEIGFITEAEVNMKKLFSRQSMNHVLHILSQSSWLLSMCQYLCRYRPFQGNGLLSSLHAA